MQTGWRRRNVININAIIQRRVTDTQLSTLQTKAKYLISAFQAPRRRHLFLKCQFKAEEAVIYAVFEVRSAALMRLILCDIFRKINSPRARDRLFNTPKRHHCYYFWVASHGLRLLSALFGAIKPRYTQSSSSCAEICFLSISGRWARLFCNGGISKNAFSPEEWQVIEMIRGPVWNHYWRRWLKGQHFSRCSQE